jgi:hypothetical protein
MYCGKLGVLAPDDAHWILRELVDLYLFSVAKYINRLKNAVMDAIQDSFDSGNFDIFPLCLIEKIYSHTFSTQDAPIQKFCCALIRWLQCELSITPDWTADELIEFFKNCPDVLQEFLEFHTEIWGERENEKSPFKRDGTKLFNMCCFHVHADGEQCDSESDYYWV